MTTQQDNLEFAVSQSVDGVLPDVDRRTLGDRLSNADATRWAGEHERTNAALRAYLPLPAIDFETFAARVSDLIAAESDYAPAALPMWPVWRRRLAVAAAIALTGAAAWPFLPHRARPGTAAPTGDAFVAGPVAVAPVATPVVSVQIGPSETMVRRGMALGLGTEAPSPAKPKVVISSVETPTDVRPY